MLTEIDLNRLHYLHEKYNGSVLESHYRGNGKTTYICSLVAGALQVLDKEVINVIVDYHKSFFAFALADVLKKQGLRLYSKPTDNSCLYIKNSSCVVKIHHKETIEKGLGLKGLRKAVIFTDVRKSSEELIQNIIRAES